MNLESRVCQCGRFLQPKVVPFLLILHEWGKDGQKALIRTDAIVLLLELLHLMLSKKVKETLTLQKLCERVEKIMKKENEQFRRSLELTASSGYHFMNIFKELLLLIEPAKGAELTVPLIDCKNGVIGVFLKRCLQEYQRLTFSQVKLLHLQWESFYKGPHDVSLNITKVTDKEKMSKAKRERDDYLGLKTLIFSHSKSENVSVELKALHLAMLLAHFNHVDESSLALSEAIRLAQSSENNLVLEHSLALLQQLTSVHHKSAQILVKEFIKTAQTQKQQLLVSTGKLQLAHLNLLQDVNPKKVFLLISDSQINAFDSTELTSHKIAIRSSALLLRSDLLHQFGRPYMSQLSLQLLCHMMSRDINHTPHRISDIAKAIHLLAKLLHNEGQTNVAIELLNTTLTQLKPHDLTGNVIEPIQCTLAEIYIERGLDLNEGSLIRDNISKLRPFNNCLASYWQIKLSVSCGSNLYSDALKNCELLLNTLGDKRPANDVWALQAKVLLLQAHILYCQERLSDSIKVILNTIDFCTSHGLIALKTFAFLQLAQCQLGLGLIDNCSKTLHRVMPQIINNNISHWKVMAYQLLAQMTILTSLTDHQPTQSGYERALQLIDCAQNELIKLNGSPLVTLINHISILRNIIVNTLIK